MNICIPCKKEMVCHKNNVPAVFAGDHVYRGDVFLCPECGNQILTQCGQPYFDPACLEREPSSIEMP